MRLTGEIDANCGMHRYPTTFPLGDDVLASVDVLVRTSWNGDGYDDDYRGVDWHGVINFYGIIVDMSDRADRIGTAVARNAFRSARVAIEQEASEYFDDENRWRNLMLARL